MSEDETWLLGLRGEWTILPRPVCTVTGTIYHKTCVVGLGRTEYPCCDLTYVVKRL